MPTIWLTDYLTVWYTERQTVWLSLSSAVDSKFAANGDCMSAKRLLFYRSWTKRHVLEMEFTPRVCQFYIIIMCETLLSAGDNDDVGDQIKSNYQQNKLNYPIKENLRNWLICLIQIQWPLEWFIWFVKRCRQFGNSAEILLKKKSSPKRTIYNKHFFFLSDKSDDQSLAV